MDCDGLSGFEKISTEDFLLNCEFGKELHQGMTSEIRDFRNRSREFLDRLVDIILSLNLVTSEVMQGLYSFCPEILLEGDDQRIFRLFDKLLTVLKRSGYLSEDEAKTSMEEFTTYVVDARARHAASDRSAERIPDVVAHLLGDYSFLSRKCLLRVFKLCCLVIARPAKPYPVVDFALDDCSLPLIVVSACVKGVQSYVMGPCYQRGGFFTRSTLQAVRDAIDGAHSFMSSSSYDPWEDLLQSDRKAFVARYADVFSAFLPRRKREAHHSANRQRKQADVAVASDSSSCVSGASLFAGSRASSSKSSCVGGPSKQQSPVEKTNGDETLAELLKKKGKNRKKQGSNPRAGSKGC